MLLGIQLQSRRKKEFARDGLSIAETQFELETRWTFSGAFQSSARKIEMRNESWTLWKRFISIMSRMLHSIMKIKWKLASFKILLWRNNSYGNFNAPYEKISYILGKTDEAVASHHPHFFRRVLMTSQELVCGSSSLQSNPPPRNEALQLHWCL